MRAIKRALRKIEVSIYRGEMEPRSEYVEQLYEALAEVGRPMEKPEFKPCGT